MAVSPFTKQLFVAFSPLLAGFAVGGAVTFPTALLHQLKTKESPIKLDFETASWIGAIHGLAGLPSVFMPTIMQWRGRKMAFIAACVISITGWILTYAAESSTLLLIGECFHGLGNNSVYAVTCLTITEMIAPKYRDIFIQFYYVSNSTAMAVSGLMVQYVHWKTICIVMCVPMIIASLAALAWPESPYWLACVGEFEKCQEAFTWLRGTDSVSQKELDELISAKKESIKDRTRINENKARNFWKQITRRDFYVPCLHITLLEFSVHGTGGIIILIYSIELFMKTTTNETVASFGSFIVNIVMLISFIAQILSNKYFKKKTLILWSIFAASVSIFSAAITSYMQSIGLLSIHGVS